MLLLSVFTVILQSTSLVAASAIPPGTNGRHTAAQKGRGISIASESQYCNDKAVELFKNNLEATAADAVSRIPMPLKQLSQIMSPDVNSSRSWPLDHSYSFLHWNCW